MIAENGALLAESRFQTGLVSTEVDVQRLTYERQRITTFPVEDGGLMEVEFSLDLTPTKLTRYYAPNPFVPADMGDRTARCREIVWSTPTPSAPSSACPVVWTPPWR